MKRYILILTLLAVVILLIDGCRKSEQPLAQRTPHLPEIMYNYTAPAVVVPPSNPYSNNFGDTSNNTPASNPTTNAGATLGRVLFYEPMLSVNNSISCGSCHKQQFAFSDNTAVSTGFQGQKGTRNALPVFNQFMNANFFWDGRINTLESQVLMPVKNHAEMGLEDMDNLVKKLKAVSYYAPLFKAANNGSSEITARGITNALAQFIRSMRSFNSKFDQAAPNNFASFTEQEKAGELAFREFRCNTCHGGNNLATGQFFTFPGPSGITGNDYSNSGLDLGFPDQGLKDVTGKNADNGKVKIPSLRNIALTGPYMHDGRFKTLDEVIEHYNSGIVANPNLDERLTAMDWGLGNTNAPVKMGMTDSQKKSLVAFLNTLTDNDLVSDPKFADPFK